MKARDLIGGIDKMRVDVNENKGRHNELVKGDIEEELRVIRKGIGFEIIRAC